MRAEMNIHVLIFDGMVDWEALALLERLRLPAVPVGFDSFPVTAASGMKHLPGITLAELPDARPEVLYLPGGAAWSASEYPVEPLGALLRQLDAAGVAIAASGSAAIVLARAGLLADRVHTGDLDELARYPGRLQRRRVAAAHDRGVFTARGDAAGELADLLRAHAAGLRQRETSAAASG